MTNTTPPFKHRIFIYLMILIFTVLSCFALETSISINNLGVPGIQATDQEYTSKRQVMLILTYNSGTATKCRYANSLTEPSNRSNQWTEWETCLSNRLWTLSQGDGQKKVYYQVNYTTVLNIAYDSIYYNHTGVGLDLTSPNPAKIKSIDYLDEDTVEVTWFNASDSESSVLGIPLRYEYILSESDGTLVDSAQTEDTSRGSDISSIPHNTTLFINLTVTNSANRKTLTRINFTVDKQPPSVRIFATYLNLSNSRYKTVTDENLWVSSSSVNLSWIGYDNVSGINSFSYALSKNPSAIVDEMPEGDIISLASGLKKTFSGLESGKYYFKIKAKDNANNWGSVASLNFSIDSTKPTKPIVKESKDQQGLVFSWTTSDDPESDINFYLLNLTFQDGVQYMVNYTTELSFIYTEFIDSGDYGIDVCAINNAGLKACSNEALYVDFNAPIITAYPNVTVITTNPVLRIWTDEIATCKYNSTDFTYTNTTYHESSLKLSDGNYSYVIFCMDETGNSWTTNLNVYIDSLSTITDYSYSDVESYEDTITTFTIEVFNLDGLLTGLTKDEFEFMINEEEIPFYIFEDGTGTYFISFLSPTEGNYELTLTVYDITHTFNLVSKSLKLSGSYEDSNLLNSYSTKHILFANEETRIGLATDSEVNLIGTEQIGVLTIPDVGIHDNLYIINTKKNSIFSSKETQLENMFIDKINPSFGYVLSDIHFIDFILQPEYNIISNASEKRKGKYSFLMEKRIARTGKKEVVMYED